MRKPLLKTLPGMILVGAMAALALAESGHTAEPFSPYVDDSGNITLPKDFRNWRFIGTWGVASEDDDQVGSKGIHNVYTQLETLSEFRKTGNFPDGAVFVKELLTASTNSMTTGEISYATETEGWFIMIKDAKGRFESNKLWGDGWGWALFNADNPSMTVSSNYKNDCLSCHVPAKDDDWIYVRGYPAFHE